jgi:hypothetical protein
MHGTPLTPPTHPPTHPNLPNQVAAGAFLLGRKPAQAIEDDVPPSATAAAPAEGADPTTAGPPKPVKTAYDYSVPYNGERVPLSKYKGKAVIVCNPKSDDPEALNQLPALAYLNQKYYKDGLKIWCFTTEQVCLCVCVCVFFFFKFSVGVRGGDSGCA